MREYLRATIFICAEYKMGDASANTFHDIKKRILDANDLELHFVALVVFNELATRRLGPDSLVLDPSGCAVTVAKKPPRATKTPKKVIAPKQAAVNEMFQATEGATAPIEIGEDVELSEEDIVEIDTHTHSLSPEPASDPRPVPERKVPLPKAKGAMRH